MTKRKILALILLLMSLATWNYAADTLEVKLNGLNILNGDVVEVGEGQHAIDIVASSDLKIKRIKLWNNRELLFREDLSPRISPYQTTYNIDLSEGIYILNVQATTGDSSIKVDLLWTVQVVPQLSEGVFFDDLMDGDVIVAGPVDIFATAAASTDINWMRIKIKNQKWQPRVFSDPPSSPFQAILPITIPVGTHELKLRARTKVNGKNVNLNKTITVTAIADTNAPSKPNIVFFLADDMDAGQVACYGGKVPTPNIDQLAAEGIKFQEAYASTTVCTPSRYTFLSGRFASTSTYQPYLEQWPINTQGHPQFDMGLEMNGTNSKGKVVPNVNHRKNIAALLNDNGYFTGFVGKYHIGADQAKRDYVDIQTGKLVDHRTYMFSIQEYLTEKHASIKKKQQQVDFLKGEGTVLMSNLEDSMIEHLTKNIGFDFAESVYRGNTRVTPYNSHNYEWTLRGAFNFLDQAKDRDEPFFLCFSPTLIHGPRSSESVNTPNISGEGWIDPIDPASVFMANRQEIFDNHVGAGFDTDSFDIAWLDAGVGALMQKLDMIGAKDNTIFIFTSDHGIDKKSSLFRHGATNIPMIVRYPEVMNQPGVNKGVDCYNLIQNTDLAPTLLSMAGTFSGINPPNNFNMDGKSFAEYISNPQAPEIHDYLYFEMGSARSILQGNYSYIANRYPTEIVDLCVAEIPTWSSYSPNDKDLQLDLLDSLGYLYERGLSLANKGMKHSTEYISYDQLYNVGAPGSKARLNDDREKNNLLVTNPSDENIQQTIALQLLLESHIQSLNQSRNQNRPYDLNGGALTPELEDWRQVLIDFY
ncbi:MAG: sulfatase-like hydrolase/transferase [Verrucomicrobiota bacterium]